MPILYRLPRLRNLAVPLLFLLCLMTLFAHPANAANIEPVGIGDLMPSPSRSVPAGQGTMYETYHNLLLWQLDSDFGVSDVLDSTLEGVADICMALITVIGSAAVVVVQWVFQLTSIPALEDSITRSIGGAASGLTATLLPAALAVGAVVAFAQHRKGGGGMSQIAWLVVSGVVSMSLLTTPGAWVQGVDTVRSVGANVTMSATAAGLGDGTTEYPFKLDHAPQFTGNGRDDMLRKSSDAVWRAYVATPWCLAEFGSFEACKKFGGQVLDKGIDRDKRKEWLQDNVTKDAVGSDSVSWRQGHNPIGRIAVTVPSLISVTIFAALVIMLAFTSLASLLGALMLLLTGVIFACLWVIPGKPRQWGLAWFDQLLGRTLESLIATLVLGAVLSLQTATTQMFGSYGWLPSVGLSIATAVVGFKFRSTVAQIFGVSGSSSGMLGGFLAAKALSKLTGGSGTKWRPKDSSGPARPGGGRGGSSSPSGGSTGGATAGAPGSGGPSGGSTPSRVPNHRPPAPTPPRSAEAPVPTPEHAVTLDRLDRTSPPGTTTAPTVPARRQPRPIPATAAGAPRPAVGTGTGAATADRPRPAVGAGATGSRPALPPARTPQDATTGTPRPTTSTLRPERGDTVPGYDFRQAPPPAAPGAPRVIRGTVVARSAPTVAHRPPTRRASTSPPPPARRTAPNARTTDAAPTRTAGRV
ncbi:hypothetical protein ABZW10_33150 [Kitasatospora sp. NPDC004723]|uniref:hypothetical protein n=1 Tax=Kitasatospora sp. NPDC004723 TaxID=3154288 RepID=UPI0033BE9F07